MKNNMMALALSLALLAAPAYAGKGTLFIIGGGERGEPLRQLFLKLAGGPDAPLVVLPMASDTPEIQGPEYKEEFEKLGFKNVSYIVCTSSTADTPENLAKMRAAKAVYMSGGDQSLLTAAMLGTGLFKEMKAVYERGGIIGGTSAGAAVMSRVMLTGNELVPSTSSPTGYEVRVTPVEGANSFDWIKPRLVETAEGFGFIDWGIVDQHFIKRQRFGRLLAVLLENPGHYGLGVDESTVAIVRPDGKVEAFGPSNVVVFDARKAKAAPGSTGVYSATGIALHLMSEGDVFDPRTGEIGRR